LKQSFQQFGLGVIRGTDRSITATLARGIAGAIEPFYSAAMRLRNAAYDRGFQPAHDLGRPTISVGNITTGGTGKTPVVKWLADQLRQRGRRPAILLRGYAAARGQSGDEAQTLRDSLNLPVQENPSRVRGAAAVLQQHPETDLFILDDGFQHRRARRDFNLVLISATQPFGHGHVLPRGLLREPLSGLKRADAFLLTRCSLVSNSELLAIDQRLGSLQPRVPIFHCDHHLAGVWMPTGEQLLPGEQLLAVESLVGRKVFLAAAIGDPVSFKQQVDSLGCNIVGCRWFDDHHPFNAAEMDSLAGAATAVEAELILVTEKDWVKMKALVWKVAVGVLKLEIRFREGDAERLLGQMREKVRGG
jgi:tetraacyldisaccharide 4'-kinase